MTCNDFIFIAIPADELVCKDMFFIRVHCHSCYAIRVEWIRIESIRIEWLPIQSIRIERNILFEWILGNDAY